MALNFADDETAHLIELYRANKSLYDKSCIDYNWRMERKAIIAFIADQMQKSPAAVTAKLEYLRTKFSLALKKYRACEARGIPVQRKWKFFQDLSFLEPHIALQYQTEKNSPQQGTSQEYQVNGENEMYGFQGDEVEIIPETETGNHEAIEEHAGEILTMRVPPEQRRQSYEHEHQEEEDCWTAHPLPTPPSPPRKDDCGAFGKLVSAELRAMGPIQRLTMKRQIMSIIYGYTIDEENIPDS